MNDDRITITLELRVAGDTLTGRAVDGSGASRSFSGWLGLVAALDALVPSISPPERLAAGGGPDTPGGNTE